MKSCSSVDVCATVLVALMVAASSSHAQAPAPVAKPSFDCAKATGQVEQLVCSDAGLAALDVRLADTYAKAMKIWPADVAKTQRAMQNGWIRGRNDCWKSSDVKACVETSYKDRLLEIQLAAGQLRPPTTVSWACTGGESKPVTVAFYNDAEPKAAVVAVGQDKMSLYLAPAASGARYASGEVEYWEHQGEATITWFGTKLICKQKR